MSNRENPPAICQSSLELQSLKELRWVPNDEAFSYCCYCVDNTSTENGFDNVAFLRTRIDWIDQCFGENEVDEIWITFPDPQIKYNRAKHRLTHPEYLLKYAKFLKPGGTINLKCDSEFLHGYTHGIVQMLGLEVEECYHDIYQQILPNEGILFDVITHYEGIWLEQGKAITYLRFNLNGIEESIARWGKRDL